ncbi:MULTISPECIES: HpcH/HpaI aldolase/citrate lyase family protein [Desulfococcus]|jgi:citrate lyase beta subunit|uniref:HpcH/HpaI aldolase n=1 Tax=Desulfococcus multivorans DSM 2059 TaxID=1121405 RepID=S7V2U1_DESML|nr:CoA ester lyase [Desulfococcus multivorans]AOY57892.1 citrate lyase [Desulfococcus multivorans]AQV00269.1 CoA ester lyase [Desulfococcus multivorans]EPR38973.1 HpcH/HpaI aldolase [Desulfococcus multivorans DSM 2059]MDX9817894.1 CoA ester lyase [Desulfococcus multivorans]SJZ65992.1 citrate lyase subunit beta / citryl-CoA lyase [Desulfococcus multivorans DSM 2059]
MKPRRSVLSVPGHVEKMHLKAGQSNADVVMLDLEDSVPLDQKEIARSQVIRSLRTNDWKEKVVTVRINGLDTPYGYRDLLSVLEDAGNRVDAVVVPKVNTAGDIHFVDRMMTGIEMAGMLSRPIAIEASIETAQGLQNVREIAAASERTISLVFGIADYSASVGARLVSISGHGEKEAEIYPGHRWHFALSRIIMTAKANGLMVIDAPYGNFKDPDGLARSAAMACAIGCNGKWAIHPGQVEEINRVFTPSLEDIQLAVKVLDAIADASSHGRGAVAVEGRMVDQATARLAGQLYEQAKYLKLL